MSRFKQDCVSWLEQNADTSTYVRAICRLVRDDSREDFQHRLLGTMATTQHKHFRGLLSRLRTSLYGKCDGSAITDAAVADFAAGSLQGLVAIIEATILLKDPVFGPAAEQLESFKQWLLTWQYAWVVETVDKQ